MNGLKTQAIQTALTGNWDKAIALNEEILNEEPDNIDTLNRLAFAYSSLGDNKKAKSLYQKVLSLDDHNPIAVRNIKRLNGSTQGIPTSSAPLLVSNLFIEEPGKTKVIDLINVADKKTLLHLRSGEQMLMQVKRMKIFVVTTQKQFVGMLPDDLSKRLIKFIDLGNLYEAYIKSSHDNKVTVFIKETKRVSKLKDQPSFLSGEKNKVTFKPLDVDQDQEDEDDESLT